VCGTSAVRTPVGSSQIFFKLTPVTSLVSVRHLGDRAGLASLESI